MSTVTTALSLTFDEEISEFYSFDQGKTFSELSLAQKVLILGQSIDSLSDFRDSLQEQLDELSDNSEENLALLPMDVE